VTQYVMIFPRVGPIAARCRCYTCDRVSHADAMEWGPHILIGEPGIYRWADAEQHCRACADRHWRAWLAGWRRRVLRPEPASVQLRWCA